jgi:IS5 family transposase
MRQEGTVQATIFEVFARHEIGCELKTISQWLDGQRALLSLVASFRAFARLPLPWSPKKSVLHQTIGALRADTWEAVNQALLASANRANGGSVAADSRAGNRQRSL